MFDIFEEIPLFALCLTFAAYQIGLLCKKKWKSAVFNPLLISIIIVIVVLKLLGLSNSAYQDGCTSISWLLTPATICLAVPLYKQLQVLKSSLPAILAGVIAGTATSLIFIFILCRLFSLDVTMTVSLLPKSITTAMGIALAQIGDGLEALTTAAIIVTGILGSLMGAALCKLFRFTNPIAQGVAFGTASHVIGTAKATEISELSGAVSSLSLVVSGIVTAIAFPLLLQIV